MINNFDDIFYGAGPDQFKRARELRRTQTEAESVLWQALRNRKLKGFKFRRQHPIEFFIADFYCHKARLVIELDGGVHEGMEQREYDMDRTKELEKLGVCVMRFDNKEIMRDFEGVLRKIEDFLTSPPKSPSPKTEKGT